MTLDQNWLMAEEELDPGEQIALDLSHEVRTLLTIMTLISGNLDLLYDRLDDEKRRQMIRTMRKHTRLLCDLVTAGYLESMP